MNLKEEQILDYISDNPLRSSKEIHENSGIEVGYATLKRLLNKFLDEGYILTEGRRKSTRYKLDASFSILRPIDPDEYFEKEIDSRKINQNFNFDLIRNVLPNIKLFRNDELSELEELQSKFTNNISRLNKSQFQSELERLAIDLSWKSSQIEGNTYSLLETERLLKEQITAEGKTRDEATMLLNHKKALDFVVKNPDYLNPISIRTIEDIHSILIEDLGVERNIRNTRVGVSGTNYRPLDNEFQIREAIQEMCVLVNRKENVFEKALLLLILLSYIQPFQDGNKRTARIVSNSCLISHQYCPLSFRTVDSIEYKKAMLIFYEQNNISAFKKIFIDQYKFAVETYF